MDQLMEYPLVVFWGSSDSFNKESIIKDIDHGDFLVDHDIEQVLEDAVEATSWFGYETLIVDLGHKEGRKPL